MQIGIIKYIFLDHCQTLICFNIKKHDDVGFHFTYKHMTGHTTMQLSIPCVWFLRTSLRHVTVKAKRPYMFHESLTVDQLEYSLLEEL